MFFSRWLVAFFFSAANWLGFTDDSRAISSVRSVSDSFENSASNSANSPLPSSSSYQTLLKMNGSGRDKRRSKLSVDSPNARLKKDGEPLTIPCVACKIICIDRKKYRFQFGPMCERSF